MKPENNPAPTAVDFPRSLQDSTSVEAYVEMVNEKYGHRDVTDRTGDVVERHYSGVTTRSMSARDLFSGVLIENLPAALDCKPGDVVRITVEVIKRS